MFNPGASMTRAMFTRILANLEGIDHTSDKKSLYSDVPDGQWYTAAVNWAGASGIINGTGQGRFAPDERITREQMAVMLYNYAVSKGYKLPGITVVSFADNGDISPWAREAAARITAAGTLTGKPGGYFDPRSYATRAEAAALFARFIRAASSS
ncbi:S-layer homology domain-containing protein [Paenibacillus sp. PK3_47]|uniref:S-layer homology domain-containing protein n=1 Tax=Paenibacillus sp. PK3_47 TaxID=2072642 RepID=UPI00201D47B3|nr:S-layer homology domain-containing protein [Paenibacillus sp. PK3_47]